MNGEVLNGVGSPADKVLMHKLKSRYNEMGNDVNCPSSLALYVFMFKSTCAVVCQIRSVYDHGRK